MTCIVFFLIVQSIVHYGHLVNVGIFKQEHECLGSGRKIDLGLNKGKFFLNPRFHQVCLRYYFYSLLVVLCELSQEIFLLWFCCLLYFLRHGLLRIFWISQIISQFPNLFHLLFAPLNSGRMSRICLYFHIQLVGSIH